MPQAAFHPDDMENTKGPQAAFEPGHDSTPTTYALQHHVALEVVAHLEQEGVPFWFRGGTALHTRIPHRTRFSSDVDVTTTDRALVHDALRTFVDRFPHSGIVLREPPKELRVEGVQHMLEFGHSQAPTDQGPVRVLVEVVEHEERDGFEPLALAADGHDWNVRVLAPTYDTFTGQKLAVLGPRTIGKPVGLNEDFVHQNQGVCKQIFDLRELLGQDLDQHAVLGAYEAAVREANGLRKTAFQPLQCLEDARSLLAHLRDPRTKDKAEPIRYGLWAGYEHSMRWISTQARAAWRERDYRIAAGVLTRLVASLVDGGFDREAVARPLAQGPVPGHVVQAIEEARAGQSEWYREDAFGADAGLAWAWAPSEFW